MSISRKSKSKEMVTKNGSSNIYLVQFFDNMLNFNTSQKERSFSKKTLIRLLTKSSLSFSLSELAAQGNTALEKTKNIECFT